MHILLGKGMEMSMRQRISKTRLYADYKQASGLLRHDLVWSEDFEAIRIPLADLIDHHANIGERPLALTAIVHNLIATENDLSI